MKKIVYSIFVLLIVYISTATCLIVVSALQKPKERGDYLLILGARVYTEGISLSLQARLDTAITYLLENPQTKVIVSGGKGENEPIEEAYAMQQYLLQHGIATERILTETRSTSTYENILFSKENFQLQHVIIVTNDYHMYRARWIANRLGIKADGIAAPTPPNAFIKSYIREYAAIIKAWLS